MAALRTAALCVAASMATVALAIRLRTRHLSVEKSGTNKRNKTCKNTQRASKQNCNQLADKFVVVVGLGGVGSHAAHMLVRGENCPDISESKIATILTYCYLLQLVSGSFE